MAEDNKNQPKTYQVKLASGRILGPLDLPRITQLMKNRQILGDELARENPVGEWKELSKHSEFLNILVKKIEKGTSALTNTQNRNSEQSSQISAGGATEILLEPDFNSSESSSEENLESSSPSEPAYDSEATQMVSRSDLEKSVDDDDEKTRVGSLTRSPETPDTNDVESGGLAIEGQDEIQVVGIKSSVAQEKTVFLQRPLSSNLPVSSGLGSPTKIIQPEKKKKGKMRELSVALCLSLILGYMGYDTFLAEPEKPVFVKQEPIRPKLPEIDKTKSDPSKSIKSYNEAILFYLKDTVTDYRIASEKFRESVTYDQNNVKALAMLASSYINLIDSSNKDENFFDVLSKLIEMSRAKSIDLPETVIADVEFFVVVNKAEAAQSRVVEYTKSHQGYGVEMYYYLALAFFSRGDFANAARFIEQFPDNKVFSSKIFYLKGQIAEKLKDFDAALKQYEKAIAFNQNHVKSRLRIAVILNKQGALGNAGNHLNFNIEHEKLLSPSELAETYYLHSQLNSLAHKWELALSDIDKSVKLEPENHDYLLEMYTSKARSGDSIQSVQGQARMYYFLGEGEKLIQLGKYQEALVPLLQAREAEDASPLPLVKIGDMFNYLHDIENAKKNYKLAAEKDSNNIQIWSKYIKTLIQSFEWEEASKAMDRFRQLPVSQSAIDKAAADMYQQKGQFVDAQFFYKKAMARPSIDPEVYVAYAKSLMSTKNFKDAPFFFALALRFDPLNVDAIISTAKCVAETESIERAIGMLQDELNRGSAARAEYLAAIADLQIQKGNWDQAQENVLQAMQINPNYAYSWKLQAQIYMNKEYNDKTVLDKALMAYKSYSERNISDPSGYLERYKIFIKKTEYEKAKSELTKIFEIYPKYPSLHYYLGALYALQSNHKVAVEEFKLEISNNPLSLQAILAYGKELVELNEGSSYREALAQFTKAMQIAPRSAEAKQNAGWVNYKLHNFTAANALMREALLIDRANPTLHKRLGIIYRDMGDLPSACASFRKYLEMEPDAPDKGSFRACF